MNLESCISPDFAPVAANPSTSTTENMNPSRNGKIARLPRSLRDEVSERIDNGQSGPQLADWLNDLPEVKTILTEHFAGQPINIQNISQWRKGGYQDWFELQETRKTTRDLATDASLLDQDIGPQKISETYATVTVADFVRTSRARLKECRDTKQRWECLDEIEKRLSRFRRDDHRSGHLSLRHQRSAALAEDRQRVLEDAADAEDRRQKLLYFELRPQVNQFAQQAGDNLKAFGLSTFLLELKHNLPTGFLTQKTTPTSEGRVMEPIIGRVPNIASSPITDGALAPNPQSAICNSQSHAPSKTPEMKLNQSACERSIQLQNDPTRPTCQPTSDLAHRPPNS